MVSVLKSDERFAIIQYESKLLKGHKKATANTYVGDAATRNRVALAVFRHVIEDILQWSPDVAFANMSMQLIKDLKLNNEWNNLDLPREIRQFSTAKYVVAMLYPRKFMPLFSTESLAIQVYRSCLEQRKGIFPKNYFLDENGRLKAQVCLRYMLNNYAVYNSIEKIYEEFANTEVVKKLLKNYGLDLPARTLYDTPLDYLHESLSMQQRSHLFYNFYRFKDNMRKYEAEQAAQAIIFDNTGTKRRKKRKSTKIIEVSINEQNEYNEDKAEREETETVSNL